MTTDYRALCVELADALDSSNGFLNSDGEWVVPGLIGIIVDRARAALAQPEPEGPKRQDIIDWLVNDKAWGTVVAPTMWRAEDDELLGLLQRAIARFTRPAIEPVPEQADSTLRSIRENTPRYRMSVIVSTHDSAIDTRMSVIWSALEPDKEILESVSLPEQLPPLGNP